MYYGERTFQDMSAWNKIIGKTYFQKNENNKDEYRTIYMKYNPFAGRIQPMYSNFVNGTPPDGMEEANPRLCKCNYNNATNQTRVLLGGK